MKISGFDGALQGREALRVALADQGRPELREMLKSREGMRESIRATRWSRFVNNSGYMRQGRTSSASRTKDYTSNAKPYSTKMHSRNHGRCGLDLETWVGSGLGHVPTGLTRSFLRKRVELRYVAHLNLSAAFWV